MNNTGMKITIVVRVEATIAPLTWRVPVRALSSSLRPFSRRRTIFSSTTMALSTISPIPRANPPKLIWLRVKSLKNSRPKVAMIEIGIDRAMMKVVEPLRRKK